MCPMSQPFDLTAIKAKLAALVEQHGSQRAAAAALGIGQTQLFDILNDRRKPGPKTLKALGLEAHVLYTPRTKKGP